MRKNGEKQWDKSGKMTIFVRKTHASYEYQPDDDHS